jgi:hypothetical protein
VDWTLAVETNRAALKRVVAVLAAMAGPGFSTPSAGPALQHLASPEAARSETGRASPTLTLPRRLHRAVLRLLRPAEAAVRRLIIVAARGLALPSPSARKPPLPRSAGRSGVSMPQQVRARRDASLPLLDRLRPWTVRARASAVGVPRICLPGFSEPFRIRPRWPDEPIDATRLAWRLQALARALDDLPGQARRFARWQARRAAGAQDVRVAFRFRRAWPLKPGRPPGWRRRPSHEVHEILNVVHGLAFWALEAPDTS